VTEQLSGEAAHPEHPEEDLDSILVEARGIAYTTALRILKGTFEAEDVASWAGDQLIEWWDRLDDRRRWRGWVRTTATRAALDHRKKAQRVTSIDAATDDEDNYDKRVLEAISEAPADDQVADVLIVEQIFDVLSVLCLEILGSLAEGYNLKEIAKRLGRSHGTTRNDAARCRALAREWLRRMGYR
jgi:RNA polymerase sigma factor (sigma-70 family)